MVVCNPEVTITVLPESDTPLVDELDKKWIPDQFLQEDFHFDGKHCASGALSFYCGPNIQVKFVQCASNVFDRDITTVNDKDGRTAVLDYLRKIERYLREKGEL